MAEKLLHNYPYLIAALIFAVGCYIVLSHTNLMRKIIGVNVMETAVFLFLVAAGNVRGGKPPIIDLANPDVAYVNPLPSALILTGIVVSVSVTALSLALVVRIHRQYGTIDADEIAAIRSAEDV
ncbi:MAG: cation:proton antiporter subunit C [Firmicutes bacterium]|nr:cation:proton antiporter subunit C [Bacillota bacterium]HOB34994.1 cation:proton antiporter subunit C [Bacillota bacterium]HPZ90971.1 cation:proton antiporter subunit C [Bacillota bacterium]HQE02169.1 cation:proton antiporter subunit C [Bacillota bacterium]